MRSSNFATKAWFTYISKRQSEFAASRGFNFHETSHKFRKNKTLVKISEFTVSVNYSCYINCLHLPGLITFSHLGVRQSFAFHSIKFLLHLLLNCVLTWADHEGWGGG